MINPNIPRWILTSASKYLKQICTEANLPVMVIGVDDPKPSFMDATDRGEIRITGPFIKKFGSTQHQYMVPINILITSRYDHNKNAYTVEPAIGAIVSAMDDGFGAFKLGNGDDDDESTQLGCFRVDDGSEVKVLRFGPVAKTEKVKEIIIDARFVAELNDE